jgi:hypothetical protein
MSEKMFAFLLSLYPPGFRERYFQEAMLVYRDRYRHETGLFRRARLWWDVLTDFVTGLPRAWQASCSAVAVPSESRILNGPSFHLLHSEPLRPAVILVGGMLTLGAVGAFTFVLRAAFLHPIQPNTMSPIESVMHRVNQPALPEAGNRALPIDSSVGSTTSPEEQTGAREGAAITAGVDVARRHAGNVIRERRAQSLRNTTRSRNAEQRQVMLESPLQESAVHPVRSSSWSHGQQAENEGPARPTAREAYVSLPLPEVQHLLSGDCATISASHELPDQIKNAFATITHTKPFALADTVAGFDATGLSEPGMPGRRLMLAGRCQDKWFIEYEHGGTAKSVVLMVLRTNPDKSVTFVWGRQLKNSARDLAQLRAALANAAFWDAPYSW